MASPEHHAPDGRFRNPWPNGKPGGIGGLLRWTLWERLVHPRAPSPDSETFRRATPSFVQPRAHEDALGLTWIGHSSFLLQIGGLNVLADPTWSDRASPVAFAGPRRLVEPSVPFDALPPIDAVLMSHDHYDHLDASTATRIARAWPGCTWVVPLGVAARVRAFGARNIQELDWWQACAVGPLRITCAPAQHFSGRSPSDRNRTLWASFVVRGPSRALYFGGDTAYHPVFREIGERLGPFDAALLPVGAYEPRWFMRAVHMNPEEAVAAFADLSGAAPGSTRTVFVPIHWGTFRLTDEPVEEPPVRARVEWLARQFPPDDFWRLAHGETRVLGYDDALHGDRDERAP